MYKNTKIDTIKIPGFVERCDGDLKFVLKDGSCFMYQTWEKDMDCKAMVKRTQEILKDVMELVGEWKKFFV